MLAKNLAHFKNAFDCDHSEEYRKGGRFCTTNVCSTLGEVLDISSCGALVLKRRFRRIPRSESFALEIRYEEIKVVLTGRTVRENKTRGVGHLMAIEFIDVTEEQHEAIREIVRNSRTWRLLQNQADMPAA